MRGPFDGQGQLVSYMSPEQRVPAAASAPDHTRAGARSVPRFRPRFSHTVFPDRAPVDPA